MKIASINIYQNYKNNTLSTSPIKKEKPINIVQNSFLPSIAPNYFSSNISFQGNIQKIAKEIVIKSADSHNYNLAIPERILSKRHVTALAKAYPEAEGITLGRGIPMEWVKKIEEPDNLDTEAFVKEFGKIFSEDRKFGNIDTLTENLTNLFRKHKILKEGEKVSVKYIGKGYQAWGYKIAVNSDENSGVAIKMFKRSDNYLQNHGNHSEQNLAEYILKHAGDDTQFVPYYFGDTKNAIMLTKYLPDNVEPPKNSIKTKKIGIGYDDYRTKANLKNDNIIDFGGTTTETNLMGCLTAQKVVGDLDECKTVEEKMSLFNKILSERNDTDEFKDKAIGLVHSIESLPQEVRAGLYLKFYEFGSHRVNIALIQNIKNFESTPELQELTRKLVTNAVDVKELETIAKEIKYLPKDLSEKFFEEQADTEVSAIIKYLSRNINLYTKNLGEGGRTRIFDRFLKHTDSYSSMSMINALEYIGKAERDRYFEEFFKKDDYMLYTTMARNLYIFDEMPKLQKKWIDKLSELIEKKGIDENDRGNVTAALAESVSQVNEEFRAELFEKLLSSKDHVTKEFLAESITSVPSYTIYRDWVPRLLEDGDNRVRGALANTIKSTKYMSPNTKQRWIDAILKDADSQVREMLKN